MISRKFDVIMKIYKQIKKSGDIFSPIQVMAN